MAIDFNLLRSELDELRERRDRLVTQLEESVERLRDSGIAFASAVLEAANDYRQRFYDMQRRCRALLTADEAASLDSLDDLSQAIVASRRQKAMELLEAAESLHIQNSDAQDELSAIISEVRGLREQVRNAEEVPLDELLQSRHPLAALLELVQNGDELNDADWAQCLDCVAGHYGRGVATSVARGKFTLSSA